MNFARLLRLLSVICCSSDSWNCSTLLSACCSVLVFVFVFSLIPFSDVSSHSVTSSRRFICSPCCCSHLAPPLELISTLLFRLLLHSYFLSSSPAVFIRTSSHSASFCRLDSPCCCSRLAPLRIVSSLFFFFFFFLVVLLLSRHFIHSPWRSPFRRLIPACLSKLCCTGLYCSLTAPAVAVLIASSFSLILSAFSLHFCFDRSDW
jgi:hypothetical protein